MQELRKIERWLSTNTTPAFSCNNTRTPLTLAQDMLERVGDISNKSILSLNFEMFYLIAKYHKPSNHTCIVGTIEAKQMLDSAGINAILVEEDAVSTLDNLNMQFDVVIGNPPYNLNRSNRQGGQNTVYNKFFENAMQWCKGTVVFITPGGFRISCGGKFGSLIEKMDAFGVRNIISLDHKKYFPGQDIINLSLTVLDVEATNTVSDFDVRLEEDASFWELLTNPNLPKLRVSQGKTVDMEGKSYISEVFVEGWGKHITRISKHIPKICYANRLNVGRVLEDSWLVLASGSSNVDQGFSNLCIVENDGYSISGNVFAFGCSSKEDAESLKAYLETDLIKNVARVARRGVKPLYLGWVRQIPDAR